MLQYAALLLSHRHTRMFVLLLLNFLSLPVTVASAERSFSKLKYTKNYLRNSMAQECLKGLTLQNIEAEVMDMDMLLDRQIY